ncbi:MAG: hypothetical protein V4677_14770 [Bacteroidota bacterium]
MKINVAGKTGEIRGHTVPSISDVKVIGSTKDDFALNIYFNDIDADYWFDAELIEMIDNGVGYEIVLGDKKFIKNEFGEWLPVNTQTGQVTKSIKKWWEFWKE